MSGQTQHDDGHAQSASAATAPAPVKQQLHRHHQQQEMECEAYGSLLVQNGLMMSTLNSWCSSSAADAGQLRLCREHCNDAAGGVPFGTSFSV
jgi:hypothetical protein